ncbi:MAG: hypothetical protein KAJ62_00535 [Desulfobacteraceae bacterium]|nr:hypothetical protein [Desulfobacteraceae bacterium]
MKKSKAIYYIFSSLISVYVLLFFAGCNLISLDKTEPEKTFFSFNEIEGSTIIKKNQKLFSSLMLMEFTATSDFKGNQFIYKNKNHYFKDYYNRFFSPPAKMIKNKCAKWLNSTKSQISFSDLILKGEILEIYCDRTNNKQSAAIIKIRFSLIEYNKTNKIIMQKDLLSGVKFNNFTPDNLITAWTNCLEEIFKNLEYEISSSI